MSVTLEFALVIPAVTLVLGVSLAASAAAAESVRLADAAGVAVRAVGRGDDAAAIDAVARLVPRAVMASAAGGDGIVCLRLDETAALGPLGDVLPLASRACAAEGGR